MTPALLPVPTVRPQNLGTAQLVAWAAGVLEGECSFSSTPSPVLALKMTDRDIVERVAAIFPPTGNVGTRPPQRPGYKPQHWCQWVGKAAVDVIWQILPILGDRRRGQAEDMLAAYYESRFQDCRECGRSYFQHDTTKKLCSDECRRARQSRWGKERYRHDATAAASSVG